MQINRHIERCRPLEDRPEAEMIQPLASRPAVQHRALKLQRSHGSLKLDSSRGRIRGRQCRERGETIWLCAHDVMEPVINALSHRHGARGFQVLRRWRIVRQNLERDAGLIHRLETQGSHIVEPLTNSRRLRRIRAIKSCGEFSVGVVLFKRDDFQCHSVFLIWVGPPPVLLTGSAPRRVAVTAAVRVVRRRATTVRRPRHWQSPRQPE